MRHGICRGLFISFSFDCATRNRRRESINQQEELLYEKVLRFGGRVFLVIVFVSSAEAIIKIETAMVQNGVTCIQGNGAVKGAQIFWEGSAVTTANKNNGGFSFFGVLPNDCVGALSDQPGGAAPINLQVLDCTPVSTGVGMLATWQVTCYDIDGGIITC